MITRLSPDARKMVLTSAAQEARRRGDRRLGTDHLLLALLHDEDSSVARAVGVDLEAARAAAASHDPAARGAGGGPGRL
jgi:ATP-dependent Clp protease ATP-binding subunit ClpA